MNALIMNWSSTNFYHGFLYAADSVKFHRLQDIPGVTLDSVTDSVLKLLDTAGLGMTEFSNSSKKAPSFANKGEAAVVIDYVEKLVNNGVTPGQIAVITPYNYQVLNIRYSQHG